MLVPTKEIYSNELICYCEKEIIILEDTNDPTKLYYSCNNDDFFCGYFYMVKDLKLCQECNVYYYQHCHNQTCLKSIWNYSSHDQFLI